MPGWGLSRSSCTQAVDVDLDGVVAHLFAPHGPSVSPAGHVHRAPMPRRTKATRASSIQERFNMPSAPFEHIDRLPTLSAWDEHQRELRPRSSMFQTVVIHGRRQLRCRWRRGLPPRQRRARQCNARPSGQNLVIFCNRYPHGNDQSPLRAAGPRWAPAGCCHSGRHPRHKPQAQDQHRGHFRRPRRPGALVGLAPRRSGRRANQARPVSVKVQIRRVRGRPTGRHHAAPCRSRPRIGHQCAHGLLGHAARRQIG